MGAPSPTNVIRLCYFFVNIFYYIIRDLSNLLLLPCDILVLTQVTRPG